MADRWRRPRPAPLHQEMLVIGLGRFGGSLAVELVTLGHDVLGVDADPDRVDAFAPLLSKAMVADTTRADVLEQIGAREFSHVVVGIGDVEASILTVAELVAIGVADVWAKAVTEPHKRILERVGATHVILPEHDMGRRIAHQVTGKVIDYIELDEGFALVETRVPEDLEDKTLAESQLRARFGVTVVFVKPEGQAFTYASPETCLRRGDMVLVAGDKEAVKAFAQRS